MRLLKFLSIAAVAATLAACGGGGGGTAAAPELRGTAAIGAPLPNATVTLRGANGTERNATANAMGEFVFTDLSGLTAPAMLRAVGNAGGESHTLFSVTPTLPTAPGAIAVTNVTPLTHAVTQQVMGVTFLSNFDDSPALSVAEVERLNTAKTRLITALADVLRMLGVPNANPFTTAFSANQTGLDKLLDLIEFRYADRNLTVEDKGDPTRSITLATDDTRDPTVLAAFPALAWDLTGLKPFIERFNAAALDDDARRALFHTGFLHEGQPIESAILGLRGSRVEQVAIDGCRVASGVETCTIRGLLVHPATWDLPFSIDSHRTTTGWQIFGNQSTTPARPAAVAPTTAAVDTGPLSWTTPLVAPANAILQGNLTGNMAFRMVRFDGSTHTVQAAVDSTLFFSQKAFGPLPDRTGNLVVNSDRLAQGLNSGTFNVNATFGGTPIRMRLSRASNAIVGCSGSGPDATTAVFLSHNLRPVTLAHALANGLAGQTFDAMDCFHALMTTNAGAHNEWFRFNPDGSLIAGNDAAATAPIQALALTRAQVDAMLSPNGLVLTAPPVASVDRAQIYELMIGTRSRFVILYHVNEGNGTRQDVMLGIPR